MVSLNTTLVTCPGLCIGPACQVGLSAGMQRHWASLSGRPQRWHAKRACATPKEKEEKKKKRYTASCRRKQAVYQMVKTNADWHILLHIFIIIKLMNIITKKLRDYIKLALYKYA